MADAIGLREALKQVAQPELESVEVDLAVLATVKFIAFVQQDRQRRARCASGGPATGASLIPDFS